ncbi:MAG: sulfate adenylyltransferase [Candidatus Hadarchaeales archaeon]
MKLVNRVLTGQQREKVLSELKDLPSLKVSEEFIADAELIATGGFTPIEGFLVQEDFVGVVEHMRLADGSPWSIPVVLPVDEKTARGLEEGSDVVLVDESDTPIALLHLQEKYTYDKKNLATKVFKTTDLEHPGVARIYSWGDYMLGGNVDLINRPKHPFERYHMDPAQTREEFKKRGWRTVVGFQTRNPFHRAHEYIQKSALETVDGLLLHPLVGWTRKEDVPADVRMKTYEVVLSKYYPSNRVVLATLSTYMRYAGPREAVFHALIRRNFGCTHFIVGRDHAGVGDYYGPYDAHRIFDEFQPGELGVVPMFFENAFFCVKCDAMATEKTCPHLKSTRIALSGTKVRELLLQNKPISEKVLRPEVAEILREYYTTQEHAMEKTEGR